MLYTISSAIASICKNTSYPEAMALLRRAGFDGVDFPLSIYSYEPRGPMCGEDWRTWVRGVRDTAEENGLQVVQAHASWEQNIPEDLHYEHPWEIFARSLEACRILGCPHLIFHPLRRLGRVDSPSLRERIHDWNVRWFYELVPLAEQYNVIMNLENTFDSHHLQKSGDCVYPYVTAEDMLRLQRDIGSTHVQLCLDTGHANIGGQDVPGMIRAMGKNLSTLHLNDNLGPRPQGKEDLHLFPGDGTLSWTAIRDALTETGFRGVLNIEPIASLKTQTEEERLLALRTGGSFVRELFSSR